MQFEEECLSFGVLGFPMSRYSGCWVGFKCVTDTVESAASVDISLDRFKVLLYVVDFKLKSLIYAYKYKIHIYRMFR